MWEPQAWLVFLTRSGKSCAGRPLGWMAHWVRNCSRSLQQEHVYAPAPPYNAGVSARLALMSELGGPTLARSGFRTQTKPSRWLVAASAEIPCGNVWELVFGFCTTAAAMRRAILLMISDLLAFLRCRCAFANVFSEHSTGGIQMLSRDDLFTGTGVDFFVSDAEREDHGRNRRACTPRTFTHSTTRIRK